MFNANEISPRNLVRALRLPFITASTLPFIFGSLLAGEGFNLLNFFLGLVCVIGMHLSANLINDYADSKSGADWQDRKFYNFFGGSKLIQEKVLSEKFYFNAAVICFLIATLSMVLLAVILQSLLIAGLYFLILFLAWSYSVKPLAFSYHRIGEGIIFLLFGPVPVEGGYFIQTKIFPTLEGFLLSLPFGIFTTAILFANEIPDFSDDKKIGKFTWVSLTGQKKAFIIYLALISAALIAIVANVISGYLRPLTLLSLVLILPALRAAKILKEYSSNKKKLMESSKITITIQALAGIILILGII